MRQKIFFIVPLLWPLLWLASGCSPMQSSGEILSGVETDTTAQRDPFAQLRKHLHQFTLENGLRVVFIQRDAGPVFAGEVRVKTGGVDELPGQTGLAHFLEHMAFKGTDRIGTSDYPREKELLSELNLLMANPEVISGENARRLSEIYKELNSIWKDNEFGRIYASAGGVGFNATTSKDMTTYTVRLPSDAFELFCWMESERLRSPVFRQFYKEKEVVLEERRERYDDDPGGKLYEVMLSTAFEKHPYRFPNIGFKEDLERVTVDEMQKFYDTYYQPSNMVLSIVGTLDPEKVEKTVRKYFGRLPAARTPVPTIDVVEPVQTAPRVETLRLDAQPRILLAYHKPVYPHEDDAKFSLIHDLLAQGRTSYLEKELVRDRRIASGIGTFEAPGIRYPSLFVISAQPMPGITNEQLRDEIQQVLDSLRFRPISEEELEAAKRRTRVSMLNGLRSDAELASMVATSVLLWEDSFAIAKMYQTLASATVDDIRRIAETYLSADKATFTEIVSTK